MTSTKTAMTACARRISLSSDALRNAADPAQAPSAVVADSVILIAAMIHKGPPAVPHARTDRRMAPVVLKWLAWARE